MRPSAEIGDAKRKREDRQQGEGFGVAAHHERESRGEREPDGDQRRQRAGGWEGARRRERDHGLSSVKLRGESTGSRVRLSLSRTRYSPAPASRPRLAGRM